MHPRVALEAAGASIVPEFARALPVARRFDLDRPVESLRDCMRFSDHAFLLELAGDDPRAWSYRAHSGLERLKGAARLTHCLGEQPDQSFTLGVLVPTYLQAVEADQPVVHRVAAVVNNRFLAYRKLTVPIRARPKATRATHILTLTHLEFVIPRIGIDAGAMPLSHREMQCLSLAADGIVSKQIAAEMNISEKTVELHLARARHKLGARTTTQAVAISLAAALLGSHSLRLHPNP